MNRCTHRGPAFGRIPGPCIYSCQDARGMVCEYCLKAKAPIDLPLIVGGQGRSDAHVAKEGEAVYGWFLLALVLMLGALAWRIFA